MSMIRILRALLLMSLLLWNGVPSLYAENEGQAELDQATEAKLEAESLADLEKVANLVESALKKGLSAENAKFANQLISSVLLDHANRLCEAIFKQSPPDRRWQFIRQVAMKDLERAIKADPNLVEAHMLIAKLQALPGGDLKVAKSSIDAAVNLFKEDPAQLAQALVLRGQLSQDPEEQIKDYTSALNADAKCVEALQARASVYLAQDKAEKAVEDLLKLLEIDANNLAVQGAVAETLANLERFEDALKHVEKVITLNPRSSLGFTLRARIYILQDKLKEASADLDEALKLNPEDVMALMMRARVKTELNQLAEAKRDVERALEIRPDLTQAVLLRSMIAAQAKKFGEAIADIKILLQADPQNVELRLQIGAYYVADNRPRKAIEMFTQMIESDEQNWQAHRARADAYLSIGEHAKAISDYEVALKASPEDSHVLNNLAWVLATSSDDSIRNAKRSIEIGLKACEVTKYLKPHILSTLAAGYAEAGEWETAIKWSTKAVELSKQEADISEQLDKELESYKAKKPWREKQSVEENTKPLDAKRDDLEA
jgi:tetratricopeptide (TPR) repeat protein